MVETASEPVREASPATLAARLVESAPEEHKGAAMDHALIVSEMQLVLAEERTALSLLRSGFAVALIPLSVWAFLIATSGMWRVLEVLWLIAPLALFTGALFILGSWVITRALRNLGTAERRMGFLKRRAQGVRARVYAAEGVVAMERDRERGAARGV